MLFIERQFESSNQGSKSFPRPVSVMSIECCVKGKKQFSNNLTLKKKPQIRTQLVIIRIGQKNTPKKI